MLWLLFISLNAVMFPLVKSEKITDLAESWVTISSVKTEASDDKESTVLHLTTDNTEIGNIDLILTQRGSLHSSHLKSTVTKCLYQGYVLKDKVALSDSPVRIKFCDKKDQNIRELSGLISLNGKIFTLYTDTTNEKWIMFSNEHIRKDLKNDDRSCDTAEAKDGTGLGPKTSNDLSNPTKSRNDSELTNSTNGHDAHERSYVEIMMFHSYDYYTMFGPSKQDVSLTLYVFKNYIFSNLQATISFERRLITAT